MKTSKGLFNASWTAVGLSGLALTLIFSSAIALGAQPRDAPLNQNPLIEQTIHQLGKELAQAAGEEASTREWLKEALASSPYIEDRIALTRTLRAQKSAAQVLFPKAIQKSDWQDRIAALPDLELYFPLKEHRSSWSPEDPVQVAVPIQDGLSFVIYAEDGSYRVEDVDFVPALPTLLLARSEIDFDDLPSALKTGKRTATYLRELGESISVDRHPSGGSGIVLRGTDTLHYSHLTYLQVTESFEPPIRGSMEIEVFGSVGGSYPGCTRITGVDEDETIYLPAPNPTSPYTIAYAVPTGTTSLGVNVYEDDDTGCVVKSGDDYIGSVSIRDSQYGQIWGVSSGDAAVRVHASSNVCGDSTCEGPESCGNCSADCGVCIYCGDNICNGYENCASCPEDCGTCTCNYNEVCETSEIGGTCPDCCFGDVCVE